MTTLQNGVNKDAQICAPSSLKRRDGE
jgi:hypothetical protein